MAFLPNSGDIILDAVLTDTGRMRLAKGDGSFQIAKFALGDEEINYGLYDKNNVNGSAYYDLTILQTPVLEAFTNNSSMMKSRLVSIARNDVLYLPVMELWQGSESPAKFDGPTRKHSSGAFVVVCDKTTEDNLGGAANISVGIQNWKPSTVEHFTRIDQGLDTTEISKYEVMPEDLIETAYTIEIDNRLGYLFAPPGSPAGQASAATALDGTTSTMSPLTPSFIDDDQIALYYVTRAQANGLVSNLTGDDGSSIAGPRGTAVRFRVGPSLELKTSDFLQRKLGTLGSSTFTNDAGNNLAAGTYRFIDSIVRITGVTSGVSRDLPYKFIKSV